MPPPPEIDDFRLDFPSQQTLSSQAPSSQRLACLISPLPIFHLSSLFIRTIRATFGHESQLPHSKSQRRGSGEVGTGDINAGFSLASYPGPSRNEPRYEASHSQLPQGSMSSDGLWNEGTSGFVQRVPETPSLRRTHQAVTDRPPSSAQCRLDFSCEK